MSDYTAPTINAEDIIGDPLYQLNLMLWLLQPLKNNYPLRPILKETGYELFAIAPPMPLIPEIRDKIAASSIQSAVVPEPDLLINRDGVKEFVIIECKRQMFGEESSTAEQFRGLLLQSGEQFNLAVGLERTADPLVNLVYISKHSTETNFTDGIIDIKNRLVNSGFQTLPVGLLGISHRENKIYICDEYNKGLIPEDIKNVVRNEIMVQEFEASENPIPIFYIPWDPNVSQLPEMAEYCERVFLERLLSAFIVRIGKIYTPGMVEIFYDALLNEATMGFYEKWRAKDTGRRLRRAVRDLINKVINFSKGEAHKETLPPPRNGMKLTVDDEDDKESLIEAVTKFKREKGWIKTKEEEQALLFEENDI